MNFSISARRQASPGDLSARSGLRLRLSTRRLAPVGGSQHFSQVVSEPPHKRRIHGRWQRYLVRGWASIGTGEAEMLTSDSRRLERADKPPTGGRRRAMYKYLVA